MSNHRLVECTKCSAGWAVRNQQPARCRVCGGQGFHRLPNPTSPPRTQLPVRKHSGPAPKGRSVTCLKCGNRFSVNTIMQHRARCLIAVHGSKPDLTCSCGRTHTSYRERRVCPAFQCDQQPERQTPDSR